MSADPYSDPLNTITGWPMASQKLAVELTGPLFAGWILHLMLFGMVQSQFATYTASDLYRKQDPLRTKVFLWTVVLLDFAASFMNAEQMFHYGTDQHRDYASLYVTRPIDSVPNLLCAVIALLVQVFLLRRASTLFSHHMLKWWLFVGTLSFLAATSFLAASGSFAVGVMWGYGKVEQALPFTYNNLTSTWLMSSLAVDCSLCATLVILLRNRYDISAKGSPVRTLIGTTIQSAALTAIFGLVGAILSCLPQSNNATANVPLFWITPLPSLYALALVTTLSSRSSRAPALVTGTILNVIADPAAQESALPPAGAGAAFVVAGKGEKSAEAAEEDDEKSEAEDELHQVQLEPAFAGLVTTRRSVPNDFYLSTLISTDDASGSALGQADRLRIQWA